MRPNVTTSIEKSRSAVCCLASSDQHSSKIRTSVMQTTMESTPSLNDCAWRRLCRAICAYDEEVWKTFLLSKLADLPVAG